MAIKLTKEDIIEDNDTTWNKDFIIIWRDSPEEVDQLKQQIMINQEKSEKWDKMKQYLYFDEKNGAVQDKQYNLDELIRLRELVEEKITCNECINCDLLQSLLDKAKGEKE